MCKLSNRHHARTHTHAEKQYPMSGDHFLYAEDPESFADMLIQFSTEYGYPAERNLFIVRAVLQ